MTTIIAALLAFGAAASAAPWTDPAPSAAYTPVRAVHVREIGEAVNQRLGSCGLAPAPAPAPGAALRAQDFNDAREAVRVLYQRFERAAPSFTAPDPLTAGARVRLAHLTELRALVDAAAAWACPCAPDGSCSAAAPACGQVTSGVNNCGSACTRTGPACPCSGCSAPAPECGKTTTGVDSCNKQCTRTAPACKCTGCSAPTPECGKTTTGVDSCGKKCTKTGPVCCLKSGAVSEIDVVCDGREREIFSSPLRCCSGGQRPRGCCGPNCCGASDRCEHVCR